MRPEILYEDPDMIAVVKPPGISTQPDKGRGEDLFTTVQNDLFDRGEAGQQDSGTGEPYLAVINRLDRPVGGIVLFAKNQEMAAKLSDLIQDRQVEKYYQAVVTGTLPDLSGTFSDWMTADRKKNLAKVVPAGTKGARKAELDYEVLDEIETDEGDFSLVLIHLRTGRHHQIRCQMAYHGCPVWGDQKYGHPGKKSHTTIGLYATRMEFIHPATGETILLHREPEGEAFDLMDQME